MRDIVIPNIIYQGYSLRRRRVCIAIAIAASVIMYTLLTFFFYYQGNYPFLILVKPAKDSYKDAQSMQFVLIDDKQIDEAAPDFAKLRGRQNRISRDSKIDDTLPKRGPTAVKTDPFQSFTEGSPKASAPSQPAVSQVSRPTPPKPEIKPAPPVPAVKPLTPSAQKQAEKTQHEPEAVAQKAPVIAKIEQNAPDLSEPEVPGTFFTLESNRPRENDFTKRPETKTADKVQKNIAEKSPKPAEQQKAEKISKVMPDPEKSPPKMPEKAIKPVQPQQPRQPSNRQVEQPINIPVRRIGAKSQKQGGQIGFTQKTSAMGVGQRSMAVLRDRYGAYMELLLRRIQEAITLQQQLSPIFFTQGVVIMNFTINERGQLVNIHHVQASPQNMPNESAAARRVLEDVATGRPLPPPTPQMLNDPEFQKITINFLFQQF